MEINQGFSTLKDRPPPEAPAGAFELITKTDFDQTGEKRLIGIAREDEYGIASPVTCVCWSILEISYSHNSLGLYLLNRTDNRQE